MQSIMIFTREIHDTFFERYHECQKSNDQVTYRNLFHTIQGHT